MAVVVTAVAAALALRGGRQLVLGTAAVAATWTLTIIELRPGRPLEREPAVAPAVDPLGWRGWLCLALALLGASLALPYFADNQLRLPGLALLAGAVAALALAGRRRSGLARTTATGGTGPAQDLLSPRARRLALGAVVTLAAGFRLAWLDTLPADMFNDLTHIYLETERVLDGQWMIYGTQFPGREPLLFYLNALLAHAAGLDFFTLKLTTALIGIATVPVVYLLGREAFTDTVGLAAALFLAVSTWHVLLSRVGFRGVLTPLVAALVLFFLLRGLRRGSRADLLCAGACVGLSLYTYTAALAIGPAVVLGLAVHALGGTPGNRRARELWHARRSLLQAAGVALLVGLPMLRFMLIDGRDAFWFRPLTRVGPLERPTSGSTLRVLVANGIHAAGMFHIRGDAVARVNVPREPHLDPAVGALFLIGLPLLVVGVNRGGNAMILAFLALLLLPSALSLAFPDEVPSSVRAAGALGTVMLLPAVALAAVARRAARYLAPGRPVLVWATVLLAAGAVSGVANARSCFFAYPRNLPLGNYPLFREIALTIDSLSPRGPVLLKSVAHWDDKDAIRLQTAHYKDWGLNGEVIDDIAEATLDAWPGRVRSVIVNPIRDRRSLAVLRRRHPDGVIRLHRDALGVLHFAVFSYRPPAGDKPGARDGSAGGG